MSSPPPSPDAAATALLDEAVGYLNFSAGTSDPKFLANLNGLFRAIESQAPPEDVLPTLGRWLLGAVDRLQKSSGAFADSKQARAVIALATDKLPKAYCEFHRDLLHHQHPWELYRPFFIGRACEAILAQGGPWNETERIIDAAIAQLNDYVGYRPTAVLESGARSDPYPHEFVRPVPLFVRGAGVATGRYEAIVSRALEILRNADPEILSRAWFDLDRLEEVALDPRAYDFDHPVNRRPNYHFGQWDTHHISNAGYYSRFVLQQVTLDALLTRCDPRHCPAGIDPNDRIDEAAAVLAGTILMASGTSGDSPNRHDSSVTLSTLLPVIASYRDDFYRQLLESAAGPHGDRLRDEAVRTRQPFGGARQHLNHELARRRAIQLQRVHLALLFARMGRTEAALKQADSVRVASARMLTAIYCRLTSGHDALDRDELEPVVEDLEQVEALLHRAIECGALVDPWNIVGFAANFSLFPAMENTVHDWRVDELIELVEQILDLAARAWSEAAAVDNTTLETRFSTVLTRLAMWWDQFASSTIEGVKRLVAKEIEVSANLVSGALNAWHKAGAAAGDIAFWRLFVDQFDSSKAFQLVIEALLDHGDVVAARALMMQWVNQRDRTPLEDGDISFHPLAFQWLATVESQQHAGDGDHWPQIAAFFGYLEANAEEYWQAPTLQIGGGGVGSALLDDDIPFGDPADDDDFDDDADYEYEFDDEGEFDEAIEGEEDDDDEERDIFDAAYDDVTFRDTTDDGIEGDIVDDGVEPLCTEWEYEADRLEQRLSFLNTVARLWKHAAITWGGDAQRPERAEILEQWLNQAGNNYRQLLELLEAVHRYRFRQPSGSHESLVEFDRLRTIKDALIQKIVGTCVETATAARLLMTTRNDARDAERFGDPIDAVSVSLLRAVLAGDPDQVRAVWDDFLKALTPRQLLYVPHSRGGIPKQVVVTRSIQRLLHDLLGWLPRLGLIRETCQLLQLAQELESTNPVGQGAVTEFDSLFEVGYQSIVRAIVESASDWEEPSEEETDRDADHILVDVLQQLTERQLDHWLTHSKTLRLSIVEKLAVPADYWPRFVTFVQRYGADLFTQKFLSLGNLRGILHQGVADWLISLSVDEDAMENIKLLSEIDEQWDRDDVVELLSIAIEAVVENYRAYRDYNTTTTQSDHGELLYMFIDFLRQRAAYDRIAWNLKPVVWAHEILVRQGQESAAEIWRQAFAERTSEAADLHIARLNALANEYGMQLPTIADRLSERFIRPLVIDGLRAMVEPAMDGDEAERQEAFTALESEIAELVSEPHGAGLDVPDWLSALEDEVTEARSKLTHVSSSDRLSRRIGQVRLSWDEILSQLND
ncbi:hypothetical protein [Lacipirellula parvula]|uniref:Uncharacterized protein n=1 Tax=Lacipirellula parvula TaxID=2650471 RepID=A0A5K7X2H7_9BACT|nr:hypothetical protein [Lacipirellula parvula]BBO30535.1 hypothetical protein PLANPX_0147 [Lacipirellula parvula]